MISALISWPDSFDFPIFRSRLFLLQMYVDEIVICFTKHGNNSLRQWLRENIGGVKFLDAENAPNKGGDWRNQSTNYMVDQSSGDILLFLEQDFLIKDHEKFFSGVAVALTIYDVVMFEETNRFHPACLFIRRNALNKTKRDFSTNGQGIDHFAMVSADLKGNASYTTLAQCGLNEGTDWFHFKGMTDNYFAPKPYFDLDSFYLYNDKCRIIPCPEYWQKEMERCSGPIVNTHILYTFL